LVRVAFHLSPRNEKDVSAQAPALGVTKVRRLLTSAQICTGRGAEQGPNLSRYPISITSRQCPLLAYSVEKLLEGNFQPNLGGPQSINQPAIVACRPF
jgi:hypothetical protein